MPRLQVIAGAAGKGEAVYEAGALQLPNAATWYAEAFTAITVLGGVDEQEHWSERVFGGLKGGLALASNLDLSPALGLAASVLGAGAGALAREARANVIVEIEAGSQGAIVALAAPGLTALMLHDRETCRRAVMRGSAGVVERVAPENPEAGGLLERSRRVLTGALDSVPGLDRVWTRAGEP
ncbi:hypothetical protein [Methylobacterium sp. D54C]